MEDMEEPDEKKMRLTRSGTDKVIAGVCGGLAQYFGVDAVIIRLVFVVLLFINGFGLLLYIILAVIMPKPEDAHRSQKDIIDHNVQEMAQRLKETVGDEKETTVSPRAESKHAQLLGGILILLGLFLLLKSFDLFWWVQWDIFWSILLILLGIWLLYNQMEK